jgi:hypothetical protein
MVATTHHYARTFFAGLFGAVAVLLVSASILVVWANRTLTDTTTYVQTVSPLIRSSQLQDFIATKVTDQLLASAPLPNLASSLLSPAQAAASAAQLPQLLTPVIHSGVVQVLASPQLQSVWTSTNQQVHAELIRQLDANAPQIELNFGPLVSAVIEQLKQTKLAPVASQINLQPSSAMVDLHGTALEHVHTAYHWLMLAPGLIVLLTIVFVFLSVWCSVHHAKTLRRVLVETGVSALLVAAFIASGSFITLPASDPAQTRVAVALAGTLLHGLAVGCLVFGSVAILLAVASKIYERRRLR